MLGSNFSPKGFSCTRPCLEKTFSSCDSVSCRPWWRSFRLWDPSSCSAGTELMALLRTSATSRRSYIMVVVKYHRYYNTQFYNLAKSLNTENFRVSHLFVHSVPQVLKICQTSSILVQQIGVLLLHLRQFLLQGFLRFGSLFCFLFSRFFGSVRLCFHILCGEKKSPIWFQTNLTGGELQYLISTVDMMIISTEERGRRKVLKLFKTTICKNPHNGKTRPVHLSLSEMINNIETGWTCGEYFKEMSFFFSNLTRKIFGSHF